jgi:asparagine synthase (glutamine-hydrolysing)
MCGIAGIVYQGSQEDGREIVRRMTAAMNHRGPDGDGIMQMGKTTFGHRRLSIIDLSPAGAQPKSDESGRFTLTFNGEIYNYQELKKELHAYPFQTQSDSEVILAAWATWGKACLKKFAGMWAFAIHDKVDDSLFLSRDRFGVKPLYYCSRRGHFAFASEIRSLFQANLMERKLNTHALQEFLLYQSVSAPFTLAEGIFSLGPGESLLLKNGVAVVEQWWKTEEEVQPFDSSVSYDGIKKEVLRLMSQSVARRMVADVPVAAFLSGGIDSSAVVALMAQQSDLPVHTFSVGFSEKDFDESPFAEQVARKYRTNHHPILLKPEQFLHELPAALAAMDHPSGDGPNSFVVSKVTAAQGIKVALSGLGGDELFAGYPFFKRLVRLRSNFFLRHSPSWVKRPMASVLSRIPGGRRGEKMADLLRLHKPDLAHLLPAYRVLFHPALAATLLKDELQPTAVQLWLQTQKVPLDRLPVLSQLSVAELRFYLHNVLLRDTDQMSMAHSLEVREPFLDHDLVRYVIGIPDQYKYPVTPKKLLTDSLGALLPAEIVNRPKMGFTLPWTHWLQNELAAWCETRIHSLDQRGVFRHGTVMEIWKSFRKHDKRILWNHVWLLVTLEEWMGGNGIDG